MDQHETLMHRCNHCGKTFPCLNKDNYPCSKCAKSFKRRDYLTQHFMDQHLTMMHWCNHYGKTFQKFSQLKSGKAEKHVKIVLYFVFMWTLYCILFLCNTKGENRYRKTLSILWWTFFKWPFEIFSILWPVYFTKFKGSGIWWLGAWFTSDETGSGLFD